MGKKGKKKEGKKKEAVVEDVPIFRPVMQQEQLNVDHYGAQMQQADPSLQFMAELVPEGNMMGPPGSGGNLKKDVVMEQAYQAANEILMNELTIEERELMKELKEGDVVIISGEYDFIERVFEMAHIPFTLTDPTFFDKLNLPNDATVFVDCPGLISKIGVKKLNKFVKNGGLLVTTDWALKNVIEKGFPGFLKRGKTDTFDDVVSVTVVDPEDEFVKKIMGERDDPRWWLEESSYPIKIVDKEAVAVLLESEELKEKYGESPVLVTFDYGEGTVYHMISHYYLQRADTRTERHMKSAGEYASEKGLSEDFQASLTSKYDSTNLSAVQSAYTTSSFVGSVIRRQKKKNLKI